MERVHASSRKSSKEVRELIIVGNETFLSPRKLLRLIITVPLPLPLVVKQGQKD